MPTFTSSTAGCDITYSLTLVNGTSNNIYTFESSSNLLTVSTTLESDMGIYEFSYTGQITGYTNTASITFYVQIYDPCV